MSTVDTFENALDGLAVETTRLAPEAFEGVLEEVIEKPAVGTLSMESVSLEGTPVATDPTPNQLTESVTGVTGASLGIAEYGSVVLPSTSGGAEPVSLFCDLHVVVVSAEDIVPDMPTAVGTMATTLADGRESAIIATGPSATADMGALVRGAHGPKRVHVLVIEQ
ncbi:lactate utilization protein C [Halalkalicoccus paucihalophilus]|uniref:Lactate utilization protein C n=1 Tax=Halalkalicoccus paucihalophilus TaxID=1008153 RepID=A0A151ACW5_9EURY|nr:LUD domain-containing protein [Halalkalicoccus paucihalophilus]KYH25434.1 lactate utilization protein C [Halalkalicoccus paucihalophilus]